MTTIIVMILLTLMLAALLFIAAELRTIVRELSERQPFPRKDREPREMPTAGQTINVNLSPVPGVTGGVAPVVTATAPATPVIKNEEQETQAEIEREEEENRRRASTQAAPARATQSGLFAVKCPHCQAENSSYRSECFNCGKAL